jgi:putative membrane protein
VAITEPTTGRWIDRVLLGLVVLVTAAVVLGYASFGRHPELLARFPGAASAYGIALRVLPPLQVWSAFFVLATYLSRHAGGRWLAPFALIYGLSLTSELLGTGYGVPFGAYHYTPMLGAEWLGRVPVVIPLSWFSMAVASYALARGAAPRAEGSHGTIVRVLLASLLLLCWDLALDPAMSHATIYWVWGAHGPYYGMPWTNLAGWYVTGIVLAAVLALLRADRWLALLSPRWIAGFYAANLLLALGMDVAAELWLAVAATCIALGGAVVLVRWRPRPTVATLALEAREW